jgi:hypothetical protein
MRRAALIEAGRGSELPELSESDVLRIAAEVGLSEESVRRALAEHYASTGGALLADRAGLAGLCGPGLVGASRAVRGDAAKVRATLERHFRSYEALRLVRRLESGSLWEPERGVLATVMRSVDPFGRGYFLAKARAVEVRVVELGRGRCHVTIVGDLGRERAAWFWGLGIGAGLPGAASAVLVAALAGATPVAAVAPVWLGGMLWLARSGYGRALERMRVGLEGLLDRLEHGESLEPLRPSWRDLIG